MKKTTLVGGRTRRETDAMLSGKRPSDPGAYRGYLIRTNALNGLCWIEQGGALVSYAMDPEDAREIVDVLLDRTARSPYGEDN